MTDIPLREPRSGKGLALAGSAPRTWRVPMRFISLSIAILVPCFWQSRIQSIDLAGHSYIAWLISYLRQHPEPGIELVTRHTNILFDIALESLTGLFGIDSAQRVAASISVLVFFFGAYSLVWTVSRRPPWALTPALAMLSYGWVFHAGFFNFYAGAGLACMALALLWRFSFARVAIAAPIILLAWLAHALPVLWLLACLLLRWAAVPLRPKWRPCLVLLGVAVMAIGIRVGNSFIPMLRKPVVENYMCGADQMWVFGRGYAYVAVLTLALWVVMLYYGVRRRGVVRMLLDYRLHIVVLHIAAVFFLPKAVMLTPNGTPLDFLLDRFSLMTAIVVLALLASVPTPRWIMGSWLALAAVFFVLLYQDGRRLNSMEDRIERLLGKLPPGQRVVSVILDENSRLNGYLHLLDRACIGRCFSYANYEPSTGHFRLRTFHPNRLVVSRNGDSTDLVLGNYVVQPSEIPMWQVQFCPDNPAGLCLRSLKAGLRNGQWDDSATVIREGD